MNYELARKRQGMTQSDVAAHLGVDQSTVSLWENKKAKPRVRQLPAIAELFNTTVDELLADDSEEGGEHSDQREVETGV